MKRFGIPTALSLCALSVFPIVSCTVDNTQSFLLKSTNDTVNVTLGKTTGSGHTFQGEKTAETNKDYSCRFVSAVYEIQSGISLPTHKQLKPQDLEVICNNKNIMSSCTLVNNVLTIPAEQMVGDIAINLLGAEIADWIFWDTLLEISEKDVKDDKHHLAKELFEVGDYKMVRREATDVGYATIIGFEQKDYIYTEGEQEKKRKAPFTFEILDPIDSQQWGTYNDYSNVYLANWEDVDTGKCKIWNKSNEMAMSLELGFMPRQVDMNSSYASHSYFYVLSLKSQTGFDPPHGSQTIAGSADVPSDQWSKADYSYYRLNEYTSFEKNTIYKRISRNKERWVYDKNWCVIESARHEGSYFFRANTSTHCDYAQNGGNKKYVSWAFCL